MPERFTARVVEKHDHGKGYWATVTVGVFDGETQVGSYARNYPSFATSTFFAFEQGGRWFALYSTHYTATRVMSLPDCKDLGGEDRSASGFCPIELFVPELTHRRRNPDDPRPHNPRHDGDRWVVKVPVGEGGVRYLWPDDEGGRRELAAEYKAACAEADRQYKEWDARNPFVTEYARWGLVGGCQWGDDGSVKVQYIDLSRASDGVITRDARFGYFELAYGVSLADGVRVEEGEFDDEPVRIGMATTRWFDPEGKPLEG